MNYFIKIMFLGTLMMNVTFAKDVVESCKSQSCLIVGNTIIEMEKKINP